jgi:hypothetical protein
MSFISERQFLEPRQYGEVLAEFVVRQLHIERLHLLGELAGERETADDLFLRHIDE